MNKIKNLILVFVVVVAFIASLHLSNEDQINITFVLSSSSVGAVNDVFLVGNHIKLGDWQPDQVKMLYLGNSEGLHRWQKQLSFDKGEILEYKFTQGSWANEGANQQGLPLENNYLTVTREQTLSTQVENWRTTAELPVLGQITGTVKYHRQLTGQDILPRDVIVWLPPSYDRNTDEQYPVLYMHDGQNIIDPNTSSFKVDWSVDEALTRLIQSGEIPPMIVVGMNSTANRTPEYSPGKAGQAYMRFVVETVKPLIDKTYRTKVTREHTLIGGSSMGGIISFMLLWQYDDVFSKALCMSPAFKIDEFDVVTPVINYQGEKKDLKVYIDNGGLGLELQLQPGIDEMLLALKQQGYQNELMWVVDKKAKHTESAWAKRFPNALKWLMQ